MELFGYRLGDLFTRFSSGKNLTEDRITKDEKYPVYGGNGLRGYTDAFNFEGECILIGRQGAKCGNVRYFHGKGYMTDHAIVGVCTENHSAKFLSLALAGLNLNRLSGQAAQPGLAVGMLKKQKILLPTKEHQDRIAEILSAYDDLIENNNKRIKILEQMAEELYKEWFVRFRFPGHENVPFEHGQPQKWELVRLQEIIDFDPLVKLPKNGIKVRVPMAALSTSSMLLDTEQYEYTESCSGSRFKNGDTLLAKITPCLENGKTAFVGGLESSEGAVGSTEYIVMRGKKINPYMVYLLARSQWFRQSAVNSMNGSDGRQRADVKFIKKLKCLLPDEETIENFGTLVKPIFDNVYLLRDQNISLRKQRDALLPRLLSGKLEVK